MVLFLGLVLVAFAFSWKSPVSFLGLAGTLFSIYARFRPSDKAVRVFMMLASGFWLAHNILVGTPVAALMEVTFLTSNIVGYRRFHRGDGVTPSPD